jgi:hypothetical protein
VTVVNFLIFKEIAALVNAGAPDGLLSRSGGQLGKHPRGQLFVNCAILLRFHRPIPGVRFRASGLNLT